MSIETEDEDFFGDETEEERRERIEREREEQGYVR